MIKIEKKLKGKTHLIKTGGESLNDSQKNYYYFLTTHLLEQDIIGNIDIPLLQQLSITLERIKLCNELINTEGLFVNGKEHPAVKTKAMLLQNMKWQFKELGISNQARQKLAKDSLNKIKEESKPINKLMKLKNKGDKGYAN